MKKSKLLLLVLALSLTGCAGPFGTFMVKRTTTVTSYPVPNVKEVQVTTEEPDIKSERIAAGLAGTYITGNWLVGAVSSASDAAGEAIVGAFKTSQGMLTGQSVSQPVQVDPREFEPKPIPVPAPEKQK